MFEPPFLIQLLAIILAMEEQLEGEVILTAEDAQHGRGAVFTVRLPGGDNAPENPDRR